MEPNQAASQHEHEARLAELEATVVDLRAVWLLLELRRAAGSRGLRFDTPSPALQDALSMHGLARLLDSA